MGCSTIIGPEPTTLAPVALAFDLDQAFGTRYRVDLDVVELSTTVVAVGESGPESGELDTRDWGSDVQSMLNLLSFDLRGLSDPEHGLDASVAALRASLPGIQPGLKQSIASHDQGSTSTDWFVERHASTVTRWDDRGWCQFHAPRGLRARFHHGGVGGFQGEESRGATDRARGGKTRVWCPTVEEFFSPLTTGPLSDAVHHLKSSGGDQALTTLRSKGENLAVIVEVDDGAEGEEALWIQFKRHGHQWLPTLYWQACQGNSAWGCSIKYTDVSDLGWRPTQSVQFHWESFGAESELAIGVTTFANWTEVTDPQEAQRHSERQRPQDRPRNG